MTTTMKVLGKLAKGTKFVMGGHYAAVESKHCGWVLVTWSDWNNEPRFEHVSACNLVPVLDRQ